MYTFDMKEYSDCIELRDWRYGAAIVGLYKYLDYYKLPFNYDDDYFFYNKEDINEEKYLLFAEKYFENDMHHTIVENNLKNFTEFDEKKVISINEKLGANTVMKKTFKGIKFDGNNKEIILEKIEENRLLLIKETYLNKSDLYSNFSNNSRFFSEDSLCCRLLGYYIDMNKKGKSTSYNFNTNTFVFDDDIILDFIPFAFTINRDAVFINDNISIDNLINTNTDLKYGIKQLQDKEEYKSIKQALFYLIISSSEFIDYDVEVIYKNRDNDYYDTLFIRKACIAILRKLKDYKCFCRSYKMNDNYYIDIQEEVVNAILNLTNVNKIVEILIKDENKNRNNSFNYLINSLIYVNMLIRGDEKMWFNINNAKKTANEITKVLEENKLRSYRTKLTSALSFRDYKKFQDILLQLSNYTDVYLDFAFPLFENFEDNINIAYAFVAELGKTEKKDNKEE